MPADFTVPKAPAGSLPRDGQGTPSQTTAVKEWRTRRLTITDAAWTLLDDGSPRSSILIQSSSINSATVIIAPDPDNYSNVLTDPACGIELAPGNAIEPDATANLKHYARVVPGGSNCTLGVSEAL